MTVAAWLFAGEGLVLTAIGAFFVVGRPPLLPEDLRFLGRSSSASPDREGMPGLYPWGVY